MFCEKERKIPRSRHMRPYKRGLCTPMRAPRASNGVSLPKRHKAKGKNTKNGSAGMSDRRVVLYRPLCARGAVECQRDSCTLPRLAFELEGSAVQQRAVLDDGQPKPRAARLARMAFIHAVKALEDAVDVLVRDADAGVLDDDGRPAAGFGERQAHFPALAVVDDGVIRQIEQDFIQDAFAVSYTHLTLPTNSLV